MTGEQTAFSFSSLEKNCNFPTPPNELSPAGLGAEKVKQRLQHMVYLSSNYIFKCNPIHFFPLNKVLFKTKHLSANRG